LQLGDIAHDDVPDGRRGRVAQVRDERPGDRLAENAEQGDQDKKTGEDRLDAKICQRRRPVLQVVGLIFLQRPPGSCEPGAAAQICWVVRHIIAGAAAPFFFLGVGSLAITLLVCRRLTAGFLVRRRPTELPDCAELKREGLRSLERRAAPIKPAMPARAVTGGCFLPRRGLPVPDPGDRAPSWWPGP